jgi:hypothetical protein
MAPEMRAKSRFPATSGLAGLRENRYIRANLGSHIRSRIESGPVPDPLFFITRIDPAQVTAPGCLGNTAGSA